MKATAREFVTVRRQQFRRVFQPSRIVLGLVHDSHAGRTNVITLCFDMYCSYKPPMMAFAVHRRAYSFGLLHESNECVLAVPGESMAEQAMYCGTKSGAEENKFADCGFVPMAGSHISTPGIAQAIANVELQITSKVRTGDHVTVFGRVLRFAANEQNSERCLLSVGPRTNGYLVLARHGVHRIGVVEDALAVE